MTVGLKHNLICWLVATSILIAHLGLGLTSVLQKSTTFDEFTHIAGGYISLKYGDYRTSAEGGQLGQRWAALPLLKLNIENPVEEPPEEWGELKYQKKSYDEGLKILYKDKGPRPYALFLPRLMILLASVGLGVVLFLWSRAIWGPLGAVITVAVYGFSPTILAHARLVTADLFAAGFFILAVLMIWRLLHRISFLDLVLAGLAVGGLLLAKFSGLLIAPMAVMLVVAKTTVGRPLIVALPHRRFVLHSRWKQLPLHLFSAIIVLLVTWAFIWLFYGFRFDAANPAMGIKAASLQYNTGSTLIEKLYTWRLLPESFLYGLSYVLDKAKYHPAFMAGKYSTTGWASFFPYAILIKTALPILILVLVFPVLLIFTKQRRRLFYKLIPLIVLMGIVLTFAVRSNLNIGHRHVLPLYPVFAIFSGSAALFLDIRITKIRNAALVICTSLILWLVVESFLIWPHYLAYFNQLVGGPSRGFLHLVDSSLDWGQDLRGLARWLDKNAPPDKPVFIYYYGGIPPSYEGIHNAVDLKPRNYPPGSAIRTIEFSPGLYCISATELQRVYEPLPGPWTWDKERSYQSLLPLAQHYFNRRNNPDAYGKLIETLGYEEFRKRMLSLELFRLCRLIAYLQQQQPDVMIGYSILIYDLTLKDLQAALFGPAEALMN